MSKLTETIHLSLEDVKCMKLDPSEIDDTCKPDLDTEHDVEHDVEHEYELDDDIRKQPEEDIVIDDDFIETSETPPCECDTYELSRNIKELRSHYDLCQNQLCPNKQSYDKIKIFHQFEMSDDNIICICGDCYDKGYRFCLFSGDVKHKDLLTPVENGMYIGQAYDRTLLDPSKLAQIPDLYDYMKRIGLENFCPSHRVIQIIDS